MDLELPIRGLAAGLIIAAPVGPVNLLCIRRTLEKGWKSGMVSGLGAALADTLYGAIAGFSITLAIQPLIREEFCIHLVGGIFFNGYRSSVLPYAVTVARSGPGRVIRQFGLCFRVPPERDQPYDGTLVSGGPGHARHWTATTAVADLASGGRHILRIDDLVDHSGQCGEPSAQQDYRSHDALDEPRGSNGHWRFRASECASQPRLQALGPTCRSVGHPVQKWVRATTSHPCGPQNRPSRAFGLQVAILWSS